ncbi:cytochrome P450 71A9-like [Papaver somniferum]|uniref:cytochrome P450 71A9-like n=1 Tax=Papaver somniferum TaxID=3469 RepID=UPI000E6FB2ED|nr:cytochrome P450 71A9-like [Papaver somniferum]
MILKNYLFFQDQLLTTKTFCLVILLFVLITLPLLVLLRRKNGGRDQGGWRLPPGPNRLPLIGNLHQLGDMTSQSLQKISNKYGPLMFIQIGSVPSLVISSTDVTKEVFRDHDIVFSGRPALYAANKLLYGCTDITFAPYGEYWKEIRKISTTQLLSPERVASFRAVREEEVSIFIDLIRKASTSMVPINLTEMSLSIINDVICRTAFGKKFVHGGKLRQILQVTQAMVAGARTADMFPWMS